MSKRNTNKNKMWATNADIETCLAITTVSSKYRESIGKTPEGFLKTYKPLLVDLVKEFGGVVRSGAQIQNYVVNWLMHNTDYGVRTGKPNCPESAKTTAGKCFSRLKNIGIIAEMK